MAKGRAAPARRGPPVTQALGQGWPSPPIHDRSAADGAARCGQGGSRACSAHRHAVHALLDSASSAGSQPPARARMNGAYRVGIDVGGTFTDLVMLDEAGGLRWHKVPTTPRDPTEAVLQGIDQLLAAAQARIEDCRAFVHGAPTGLLTHPGLPGRPGDGPGAALRHLRSLPQLPAAAGPAAAPAGG